MTDPTTRLIASTRRRLVIVTFLLIATLVIGVGAATAIAGLGALDADVDRALTSTVEAAVAHLDGELPQEVSEGDEGAPASSDTVIFYLDATGALFANPAGVHLAGLPDTAGLPAISGGAGRDLRTVTAGGIAIRLLTVPILHAGKIVGYVQGGFVLTLHDAQSRSLVLTIVAVGLAGLLAAVFVTLLVTGRALVPVRRSFDAQRRFVADASHELRTPAAIIRANAEVLQREGRVDEEGGLLADDIIAEADRLGRLVDDLLTLAASDAGSLTIVSAPIDLAQVARDTTRAVAALAAERHVELVVEAPAAVPVSGDSDRLKQLAIILLDNAIAHSPEGGVVRLDVSTRARQAILGVSDQGPGVPPEDRERIFEAFTRLRRDGRTRTRGTGLGLAIGRRIAEAHQGSIGVDVAPGGGARFEVTLPLRGHAA